MVVKIFRRSYRAFPAGPTPLNPTPFEPLPQTWFGPDFDLILIRWGPQIHRIGSKSGQNRVWSRPGGRGLEGVGFRGVGPAMGRLCSSSGKSWAYINKHTQICTLSLGMTALWTYPLTWNDCKNKMIPWEFVRNFWWIFCSPNLQLGVLSHHLNCEMKSPH